MIDNVELELINRYKYLYNNKELILSLCIEYDIEEKRLKKEIKEITNIDSRDFDDHLKQLQKKSLMNLKKKLKKKEPYLKTKVKRSIINSFEEFLLSDKDYRTTTLYKRIEGIKKDPTLLEKQKNLIESLKIRRSKNLFTKDEDPFTVWKILNYVRNKNKNNNIVLKALDKYYNLDRYMLTNRDTNSGYYLSKEEQEEESINGKYPNRNYNLAELTTKTGNWMMLQYNYYGNELEREDNYWESDFWEEEGKNKKLFVSEYTKKLAEISMLKEEEKDKIKIKK